MCSAAVENPNGAVSSRIGLARGTLPAVAIAVIGTIAAAVVLGRPPLADAALVWRAAVLALAGGALLGFIVLRTLSAESFGAANAVTLGRGALTVLLAALLPAPATVGLGWLVVILATLAVALDGVDGRLARGRGEASIFGARFDMETDALLILVLAAFVWHLDKAGAWVLASGALRYAFVLSGYVWPWLRRPLPPSRRRQAVCVVQIATLIGALLPIVAPPWSALLALAGLASLVVSFAVDVASLARRAAA